MRGVHNKEILKKRRGTLSNLSCEPSCTDGCKGDLQENDGCVQSEREAACCDQSEREGAGWDQSERVV
ncbi:hypothetical protein ANANG_G00167190 [Anguilla anguilla]|uniref:Uncharacterized protein n=1 Tax=Anguilla anguilla TaxID=7936 RepID=A0A9D3M9A9_ANGAN|nr:hypothetical protein ANANG_G00167190 [Anguilla anguilla]